MWYHEHVGGSSRPIVDTWWQTETGGHMITPLPGVTTTKPGSACHPIPGSSPRLSTTRVNRSLRAAGTSRSPVHGRRCYVGSGATPSATSRPTGAPTKAATSPATERRSTQRATSGCSGRVDDVMNVSGHRISTAEVESALVDHSAVAEAAVVGAVDDTTGQAITGYVILRGGNEASEDLREEIRQHVGTKLGPIARPKAVFIVPDLPKTRSGKIMRRLLRDVAEGRGLGDTTTLADASVVEAIQAGATEDDA